MTTTTIQPRVYRVLFPHGNYVINENTGEQTVPMLFMGLIKINDGSEPTHEKWARTVKPEDFYPLLCRNKEDGVVRNFAEFEETVLRAARQPDLVAFTEETLELWEAS